MCIVNLTPSGVVGAPNGRWFLVAAAPAGGWAGELDVSCDGITFTTITGLPSSTVPLDNGCGDTTSIYVDLTPFTDGASLGFRFVSPDTADYTNCIPTPDACVDCSSYPINFQNTPEDVEFALCTDDSPNNIYDIAGLDCSDWDVDYQLGSPEDTDFDFMNGCNVGLGDFNPADISPQTYIFEFTHKDVIDGCGTCVVTLTLTITEAPEVGTSFSGSVCV